VNATTITPTKIEICISDIDTGDTVLLPGDPTPRLVARTWFVTMNRDWAVQVEEGVNGRNDIYLFHVSDERKAILIDRPGYGPFNRTYKVGDKVFYRFGKRDNQFGVVVAYSENPLDPTDRAYEIRSATTTGYARPESMRYVDQPAFAVGQRWHCVPNGRYGTIIGLADEIGLIVELRLEDTGTVGRFVLSSPFWELVEDVSRS
jgi:hypothetical protein